MFGTQKMFDARQQHATQHENVMSGSCLEFCFEKIMLSLIFYPRDMHDLLLCWSVDDTKILKIRKIEHVSYGI